MYICVYVYVYIYTYTLHYITVYDNIYQTNAIYLDDPHREPGSICKVLVLCNLKTGLLLLGHQSNHHTSQPPGDNRQESMSTRNKHRIFMYSQLKTELRCLKDLKDLTKHPNDSVCPKTQCNCSTRLLFSVRPHNFHKEHQYFEGTWPGYHKIHWWITLFSSIVSAKLSIHWKPIPFFQPSCKSGMEIRSCMQTAPSNMKKPRDTYLVICSRFPDQSKRKAEVILATGATWCNKWWENLPETLLSRSFICNPSFESLQFQASTSHSIQDPRTHHCAFCSILKKQGLHTVNHLRRREVEKDVNSCRRNFETNMKQKTLSVVPQYPARDDNAASRMNARFRRWYHFSVAASNWVGPCRTTQKSQSQEANVSPSVHAHSLFKNQVVNPMVWMGQSLMSWDIPHERFQHQASSPSEAASGSIVCPIAPQPECTPRSNQPW